MCKYSFLYFLRISLFSLALVSIMKPSLSIADGGQDGGGSGFTIDSSKQDQIFALINMYSEPVFLKCHSWHDGKCRSGDLVEQNCNSNENASNSCQKITGSYETITANNLDCEMKNGVCSPHSTFDYGHIIQSTSYSKCDEPRCYESQSGTCICGG